MTGVAVAEFVGGPADGRLQAIQNVTRRIDFPIAPENLHRFRMDAETGALVTDDPELAAHSLVHGVGDFRVARYELATVQGDPVLTTGGHLRYEWTGVAR